MFWKILDSLRELDHQHPGEFNEVLDVGSRNINGSVRDVLQGRRVIGIDFIKGKDVDIVLNAHDIAEHFKHEIFDLVTCCETIEHDNKFWLTIEAMKKVTKQGGYIFLSAPGINFFKHDFPSDYYRFTEEAFMEFFLGWEDVHVENYTDSHSEYVNKPNNIIGWARKPIRKKIKMTPIDVRRFPMMEPMVNTA